MTWKFLGRTVEGVILSQSRSIALIIVVGAATWVVLILGLAASGQIPFD